MDSRRYFNFSWSQTTLGSSRRHGSKWNTASSEIWSSHFSSDCQLVNCYNERERHAELKMLKLLLHGRRECGGYDGFIHRKYEGPSDAEIIFGDCSCDKILCSRQKTRAGWDGSRLEWLFQLERRHQLRQVWHEENNNKTTPKQPSSNVLIIRQGDPVDPPAEPNGCWTWLRHIFCSDPDNNNMTAINSEISI